MLVAELAVPVDLSEVEAEPAVALLDLGVHVHLTSEELHGEGAEDGVDLVDLVHDRAKGLVLLEDSEEEGEKNRQPSEDQRKGASNRDAYIEDDLADDVLVGEAVLAEVHVGNVANRLEAGDEIEAGRK